MNQLLHVYDYTSALIVPLELGFLKVLDSSFFPPWIGGAKAGALSAAEVEIGGTLWFHMVPLDVIIPTRFRTNDYCKQRFVYMFLYRFVVKPVFFSESSSTYSLGELAGGRSSDVAAPDAMVFSITLQL